MDAKRSVLKERGEANGFTLVELLVTTGIVVLMTAVAAPAWRAGQRQLSLNAQAYRMAQNIRLVVEYSLQGKPVACPGAGSLKGYGIYISSGTPGSYLSFAECGNNWIYVEGQDAPIATYALEDGVFVSAVSPGPNASAVFAPPDPLVYLGPGNPSVLRVTLALSERPQETKEIIINTKGVIEIQ